VVKGQREEERKRNGRGTEQLALGGARRGKEAAGARPHLLESSLPWRKENMIKARREGGEGKGRINVCVWERVRGEGKGREERGVGIRGGRVIKKGEKTVLNSFFILSSIEYPSERRERGRGRTRARPAFFIKRVIQQRSRGKKEARSLISSWKSVCHRKGGLVDARLLSRNGGEGRKKREKKKFPDVSSSKILKEWKGGKKKACCPFWAGGRSFLRDEGGEPHLPEGKKKKLPDERIHSH